jgi:hypothetical protein
VSRGAHRQAEAGADVADPRGAGAVEDEATQRVRRDRRLRHHRHAGAVERQPERGQALAAGRGIDGRHDRRDRRQPEVRDEHLLAGQAVAVSVGDRPRGDRRDVAAGLGLGQGEGRDRATGRQVGQPRPLRGVARGQDRVAAQPLDREDRVGAGVDPAQELAGQAQRARPDLAVGRRHQREQPGLGQGRHRRAIAGRLIGRVLGGGQPRRRRPQPLGQRAVAVVDEPRQVVGRQRDHAAPSGASGAPANRGGRLALNAAWASAKSPCCMHSA